MKSQIILDNMGHKCSCLYVNDHSNMILKNQGDNINETISKANKIGPKEQNLINLNEINESDVIKIQSLIRGYLCRKKS